jgi:hypothetical protein
MTHDTQPLREHAQRREHEEARHERREEQLHAHLLDVRVRHAAHHDEHRCDRREAGNDDECEGRAQEAARHRRQRPER